MLLAVPRGSNKPIGHISAVINTNSTGWVSMFIVDEAYRGKAIGAALFDEMMHDFRSFGTKIVGLDGVAEQKATYERRGFVESQAGVLKLMNRPLFSKKEVHAAAEIQVTTTTHLVSLDSVPHHLLAEHELKYTGFERRSLWNGKNMFDRPDVIGWALVSKAKPDSVDDIFAWAMVRRCSSGARIGPVYAHDAESAKVVLAAAVKTASVQYIKTIPLENEPLSSMADEEINEKASLVAEVWTGNADALGVFEQLGWTPSGLEYHRMWLDGKATPQQSEGGLAQKGLFAVFDAAIG